MSWSKLETVATDLVIFLIIYFIQGGAPSYNVVVNPLTIDIS